MLARILSIGVLSLTVFSLTFMTGCMTKQSRPAPADDNRLHMQQTTPSPMTVDEGDAVNHADGIGRADAAAVAAHLETLAKSIRGVQDANCVVFGKYAIVGIDVDAKMERSSVGTIKYAVAEAFRKDPYGIDALVTADIDMTQRLREIRADAAKGRPIAGFAEELADIVGRLVPQIPRSIIPPQEPENTGPTRPPAGGK